MTDDLENVDPSNTRFVQSVMRDLREQAAREEGPDPVDRILTAATLIFAALNILWPTGKKTPTFASLFIAIGQQIWRRRSWWMP